MSQLKKIEMRKYNTRLGLSIVGPMLLSGFIAAALTWSTGNNAAMLLAVIGACAATLIGWLAGFVAKQ